jgi:hypothetical protein
VSLLSRRKQLDVKREDGKLLLEAGRRSHWRPKALHFLGLMALDWYAPGVVPLRLLIPLFVVAWLWDLEGSQKLTISTSGIALEPALYLLRLPSNLTSAEIKNLRTEPSSLSLGPFDLWRQLRGMRGPVVFQWRDQTVRWGEGLSFSDAQRAVTLICDELAKPPMMTAWSAAVEAQPLAGEPHRRSSRGEYTQDSGPQ